MPGLDINLFRVEKGGNPDILRQSCQRRGKDPKIVDQVIELDKQWREANFKSTQFNKQINLVQNAIGAKKAVNKQDPCTEQLENKEKIEKEQAQAKKFAAQLEAKLNKLLSTIGNIVHESVPISNNENDNRVERKWGEPSPIVITGKKGGLKHDQVLKAIGGYDPKRGQNVAGHRGYFLKGPGVLLNQALINYGIQFLTKAGYTIIQPPYFMKKEVMAETCQLSDFEQSLYQVLGGDDEYYLIATSEQPISALHREQWLDEKNLPIHYAGYSSCFRKEAGAHGKDNWGIFRVHQFEKIQQFVICKPEDSWKIHEEMIKVAEDFYQSLELPYQVINIVSGALNDAAAKKYDLQAWFPGYNTYRELVSCSNCTDYQSRNLNIRYRPIKDEGNEKKLFVHMLNATLTATERTLCCILENYQTEQGVRVPKVLQPFYGAEFIPFVLEEQEKEEKKEQKKEDKKKGEKKKENKKVEEPKNKQPKQQGQAKQQVKGTQEEGKQ